MKFIQFACGVESILFLISLVDLVFLLHLFFYDTIVSILVLALFNPFPFFGGSE